VKLILQIKSIAHKGKYKKKNKFLKKGKNIPVVLQGKFIVTELKTTLNKIQMRSASLSFIINS
jgi:hypothetical protein